MSSFRHQDLLQSRLDSSRPSSSRLSYAIPPSLNPATSSTASLQQTQLHFALAAAGTLIFLSNRLDSGSFWLMYAIVNYSWWLYPRILLVIISYCAKGVEIDNSRLIVDYIFEALSLLSYSNMATCDKMKLNNLY